jgi:hypothetical protein
MMYGYLAALIVLSMLPSSSPPQDRLFAGITTCTFTMGRASVLRLAVRYAGSTSTYACIVFVVHENPCSVEVPSKVSWLPGAN